MFTKDDVIGVLIAIGLLVVVGFIIALIIGYIRIKIENATEKISEIRFNKKFKTLGYIYNVHYRTTNEYFRFRKKLKKQTKRILKSLPKEYIVFEDICINKYEKINEITRYVYCDFVILSKYGLFLINLDNRMGVIEGCTKDNTLIHYTTGIDKFIIQNPYLECKWLESEFAKKINLGFKDINIVSYRVFGDKCRLSFPYFSNLINKKYLLYSICQQKHDCLSDETVEKVSSFLSQNIVHSNKKLNEILLTLEMIDEDKIKKLPKKWIY